MAILPTQVRPGDVISAELMNAILDELAALSGTGGGAGTQVVPNLFGAFLADARAIIIPPARQLTMGFTYDVGGAAVDPTAPANANLVVLNQSPVADTRVPPSTPVNLVVSLSGVGPPPGGGAPVITRTETLNGTVANAFPVNGTMVVVGTNFSANAAQNVVRFAGVAAVVSGDPGDPTRRLFVVVPVNILGAPVNPGDPPLPGVQVTLVAPGGATDVTVTINAPVADQPTIATVLPLTQFETSNITITGTNFAPTSEVRIRNVVAQIVSVNPTQIVATVPQFDDVLPGPPVPASLRVIVPAVGEAIFGGNFRVRGA